MNAPPLSTLERQDQLLRYIEKSRRVSVSNICERFQISEATARRDLGFLAERGKIQRVRGVAISVAPSPNELPVYQRMNEYAECKRRIGQKAAELVEDGETVFLGSGTTVLEVARSLAGHRNLTVITNSLLVLNQLIDNPGIAVIALGGQLRRSELSMIGHITDQALAELRTDKVIIGIHAISAEEGLTNRYLPETQTDRHILQTGRKVIIVADHTKCGRVSAAFVAPLSVVDTLVTDREASEEFVETLTRQGVSVILA